MTEKIRSPFPARAALFGTVLAVLPGCAVVDLLASGASDGTKYVIRKVEEQQQEGPAGTAPAIEGPAPAARPIPVTPPAGQAPTATAAPVIPVTRGEPLE